MVRRGEVTPGDGATIERDCHAGKAREEWVPLRPDSFYSENGIDLRLGTNATGIDARAREVVLEDGTRVAYDRLLLATGAEPVRLSTPGAELPHVRMLRSLADSRAIIERSAAARRAVVLGASFIRLEAAARALAGSAHGRKNSCRTLGRRRAAGPGRGAQHARISAEVRRRAVLLEPAL